MMSSTQPARTGFACLKRQALTPQQYEFCQLPSRGSAHQSQWITAVQQQVSLQHDSWGPRVLNCSTAHALQPDMLLPPQAPSMSYTQQNLQPVLWLCPAASQLPNSTHQSVRGMACTNQNAKMLLVSIRYRAVYQNKTETKERTRRQKLTVNLAQHRIFQVGLAVC